MERTASVDLDGYLAPSRTARAEVRDRGSRFLAIVSPAANEDRAQAALASARAEFPQATHHCWAWRLGPAATERSSDDGEPSGTAGVPMLQVLRGAELSDVLAVVVRWFGGTKLGKGGLARAYAAATREALAGAPVARRVPTDLLTLEAPYDRIGAVKRLIHPPEVTLVEEAYAVTARWQVRVHRRRRADLEASLAALGVTVRGVDFGVQQVE